MLGAKTYRSTFALLESHDGPGRVVMDDPRRALEVESFRSDIGGDEMKWK